MSEELKQFLFFLTFPENKQKVYRDIRNGLSVTERNIIIQMERRGENEWREAA